MAIGLTGPVSKVKKSGFSTGFACAVKVAQAVMNNTKAKKLTIPDALVVSVDEVLICMWFSIFKDKHLSLLRLPTIFSNSRVESAD